MESLPTRVLSSLDSRKSIRAMHVTIASISLALWHLFSFTDLSLPISLMPTMVRGGRRRGVRGASKPTESGILYPLLPSLCLRKFGRRFQPQLRRRKNYFRPGVLSRIWYLGPCNDDNDDDADEDDALPCSSHHLRPSDR
jgi:hypothetical protein